MAQIWSHRLNSIPETYMVTCDMEREVRFHEESHLRNNSSYARTLAIADCYKALRRRGRLYIVDIT